MQQKSNKQLAKHMSTRGLAILKLAKKGKAKLKTAQLGSQELGPDDVTEMIEQVLLPAVDAIAEVGATIVEGVPGGEGDSVMNNLGNEDKPELGNETPSIGESDDDEEEDDDPRIAKMAKELSYLKDENTQFHKAKLAKEYGGLFPHMKVAMEQEIMDSTDSLDNLKLKVASAKQAVNSFSQAGMLKQQVHYKTAKLRTAKNGELPWALRT